MVAAQSSVEELRQHSIDRAEPSKPISLRTMYGFPVQRRPKHRELSTDDQGLVDRWFDESEITVGPVADTLERRNLAERLLYTWKDCFARTMRDSVVRR